MANDIVRIQGHHYLIDNGITVPHLDPLFLTDVTLSVRRLVPVTGCSLWRAPVYVMFFNQWVNLEGDDVFEAVVLRGGHHEHSLFSVWQDDKGIIINLLEKL